jgi:hypothetical protein
LKRATAADKKKSEQEAHKSNQKESIPVICHQISDELRCFKSVGCVVNGDELQIEGSRESNF